MKRFAFSKLIPLLLAAVLLLAALSACGGDRPESGADEQSDMQQDDMPVKVQVSDGKFTLRCSPERSYNPFYSDDELNLLLSSLMYEGLFRLDRSFAPHPVLCRSYTVSEDGLTYTLTLLPDVKLTDGSALTADDAVYSIDLARECDRYKNRLSVITGCEATGPLTLDITIDSPNASLPALLDFPIVREYTGEDDLPIGSGPYFMARTGSPLMGAFKHYRAYDELPLREIYLTEYPDSSLSESFAEQRLDLVWDDTGDGSHLLLRGNYEVRGYTTTILQYIGFNTASSHLDDPLLRRAMSLAIDRSELVRGAFDGGGSPAVLVLPQEHWLYDSSWEAGFGYSQTGCAAALKKLGLAEKSGDAFLDFPSGGGKFSRAHFRFIVNSDNPAKVKSAQLVTQQLRSAGLDVRLESLAWEDFVQRLEGGDFDMYYAEVGLPPDFDLSLMLSPYGSLDFGYAGTDRYAELIDAFLSASDDEAKAAAAKQLCREIAADSPVIPLIYRENEICTHRGAVFDAEPSVSGVFSSITDWTIDLG